MKNLIKISIILIKFNLISTNYLEVETFDFRRPKLERTNKVNKGVWMRNKLQNRNIEKHDLGDFIFRANSLDVDNILQSNFNEFEENDMQNSPVISGYVERNRRSAAYKRQRRFRKSVTVCDKRNCKTGNNIDKPSLIKSKLITKLKPASVFNDYPYEIAIQLDNNERNVVRNDSNAITPSNNNLSIIPLNKNKSESNTSITVKSEDNFQDDNNTKRSMKNYESKIIKKLDFIEDINQTKDRVTNKVDRDLFNKVENVWRQNAAMPHRFNLLPTVKDVVRAHKPITERGLVKILSILTKNFKKIMKQHDHIKQIHDKMIEINKNFVNNVITITEKFKDFDDKYMYLLKFNERVKLLEGKIATREDYIKTKEKELADNLLEFGNQQKKFLSQQRQFYNIQKLMLAQNEKINAKQSAIAKTQSDISHRHNNVARILKKAKQVYTDNKLPASSKITSVLGKFRNITSVIPLGVENKEITHTTTISTPTTDPMKINLFAIPTVTQLKNQDDLLLNEKDYYPIDDLVYKYYFNNTFIDTIIRNNFLSSFISKADFKESQNVKNKRNEDTDTTILLPVNQLQDNMHQITGQNLNRERRWISHHSHKKSKRKNRGKGTPDISNNDDEKLINNKHYVVDAPEKLSSIVNLHTSEPFLSMARNFCNGIGQNANDQMLAWCVEKSLRKLQNIEIKMHLQPSRNVDEKQNTVKTEELINNANNTDTTPTVQIQDSSTAAAPDSIADTQSSTTVVPNPYLRSTAAEDQTVTMFFPDNDDVEWKLKQYDLTPDTEGNVYFDGSLHASDLISNTANSGSDIMPGFDSNSKIDNIDPMAFDPKAMRQDLVRRMQMKRLI